MLNVRFERDTVEFIGSAEDLKALAAVIQQAGQPQQVKSTTIRAAVDGAVNRHVILKFQQGKSVPAL
jgi:hypothetical protein